jgi:hypothetical protein
MTNKGTPDDIAQRYLYVCDERDMFRAETDLLKRLLVAITAERDGLRVALRQILEDPDAKILNSHRDDGWEAL